MPIRELREKYGNGKARQVVNRAVQEELVGGGEALDLLAAARSLLGKSERYGVHCDRRDVSQAVAVAERIAASMRDEIARRYDLKTGTDR